MDAPDTPGLAILKRFDTQEKPETPEEVKVTEKVELDWQS